MNVRQCSQLSRKGDHQREGCEVHKQDELVCTFHLVLVVSFFIPSFLGRRRVKNHVVFTHSLAIPQPEDDGARGAGFGAGWRKGAKASVLGRDN